LNFKLRSNYDPRGDQPAAIDQLARGLEAGEKHQVLLGVTGSGKTFTMARVMEAANRPSLVLAHNKRLPHSFIRSSKISFRKTPSNTSSATTIFTSRKRTFPLPMSTSKKNPPSMTSSISSA